MDETEFDKFADEYRSIHQENIKISGEGPEYFAEYKIREAAQLLRQRAQPAAIDSILDFGAGTGNSVPYFEKYFEGSSITCLDVSQKSLDVGRNLYPNSAAFVRFDGTEIPFPDSSFSMVFTACVFHHIDHDEHVGLLREFRRVLKPGGTAIVFEHNPYNPLTLHAVNTCPFDENAVLIKAGVMLDRMRRAGFSDAEHAYQLFVPGVLRVLRPVEKYLRWLPLGAQYYAYASKTED